jgi:hypothetical protein
MAALSAACAAPEPEASRQEVAGEQEGAGQVPPGQQAASPREAPGEFSPAQFAELRWLEGTWRGWLPDGGFFYERYEVASDTTIRMYAFSDSTLTQTSDSARIVLRGGRIYNEGGARWVATHIDSSGIHFAPERGASNRFTWMPENPDSWTATLSRAGQPNGPGTVVYPMERFTPRRPAL